MDMPGLSKEDINLRLTEDNLFVSAEKKKIKEKKEEGFYRSERMRKSYCRSTTLGERKGEKDS
jgi:HSP20 family protein